MSLDIFYLLWKKVIKRVCTGISLVVSVVIVSIVIVVIVVAVSIVGVNRNATC